MISFIKQIIYKAKVSIIPVKKVLNRNIHLIIYRERFIFTKSAYGCHRGGLLQDEQYPKGD
ncbi:MAG: hypothetical protein DRI97_16800 [Bacteroidetes bacterium]|nr:MAG: hypothetical protein DRI97_16800 [Bacteroidota bacterium]